MNRKRYLVALSVFALAHALNGQTYDFDKYLQEHRIQPVVLKDPGRFLQPGTGLPAAPSSGPERLEKVKLRMPGAKTPQEFDVIVRDGLVFLADDIALMTEEELELKKLEKGSVITASFARWTNGKIPYVLSPTHSKYNQIQQAIAYLNARTNLCIVPRSNEVGYIEFVESTTQPCYSFVGRTGGRQVVNINDCGVGGVLHELCHVAGLFHEHTRSDRDTYVILYPENMNSGSAVDFARIDSTALDYGPYDYGSIMHYGTLNHSKNGEPTMEVRIPPGTLSTVIGQLDSLSPGDISAIQYMYPVEECLANPNNPYIALSQALSTSPSSVTIGTAFTLSINVLNLGNGTFNGCYYAGIFDADNNLVRMLSPVQENNNLVPGGTYVNGLVFQASALFNSPGQYYIGLFYRNNCSGEYITMGSDLFPTYVPFTLAQGSPLSLTVSPTALSYTQAGGTQSAAISANVPWTVSSSASWASVSATTGTGNGTLQITCAANSSYDPRTATITVAGSGGVAAQTIAVTQVGTKPPLEVTPAQLDVPANAGSAILQVAATADWQVTESASWVSVSPLSGNLDGTVTISYQQNTAFSPRAALVYFTSQAGAFRSITISQAGASPTLSVAPSTPSFSPSGGTTAVSVEANIAWTVSESLDWLSVSTTSGSGNGSFSITCQNNPDTLSRTGTIVVSGTNVSPVNLLVTQLGVEVFIRVSPSALAFSANGADTLLAVTTALAWTAETTAEWLVIDPGINDLSVYCYPNFNALSRAATITLRTIEGHIATVNVSQAAALPVVDVSEDTIAFKGAGGVKTFDIASNTNWRVTEFVSWLTVSPFSGRNDTTIRVTCQPRTGTYYRTATITVSATGAATRRILVTQTGAPDALSVSPTALNVSPESGNAVLSVSSNINWFVSEGADWVTVSPDSGVDNGTVIVSYTQNTSTNPRSTILTLYGGEVPEQEIVLTQLGAAPVLSVAPDSLSFQTSGGSAQVSISANVPWTLTESADWISLNKSTGTQSDSVVISCLPSSTTSAREATILLSSPGLSERRIQVAQLGVPAVLFVLPDSLSFSSSGGSANISISSNTNWSIIDDAAWISVDSSNGSNNRIVQVACLPNDSTGARSATLSVTAPGAPTRTLRITQSGAIPVLSAAPLALSYADTGGVGTFSITSNSAWSLAESLSWLSVAPASGFGSATVTATALANSDTMPRTGTVTLSSPGLPTVTLNVNQFGKVPSLSIVPDSFLFTPFADTALLTIFSNVNWTISESLAWIRLSALTGVNNGSIEIIASPNPDTIPRFGTITVSGSGVPSRTLTVWQAAAPSPPPTSWNVIQTPDNHTVILSDSLLSNIAGKPLQQGDYVGIFYTAPDGERCAGQGAWQQAITSFPVYGNNPSTPAKDGMLEGEEFIVKVWQGQEKRELVAAQTSYAGIDELITATNKYSTDGISKIIGLLAYEIENQDIALLPGWNTISSYLQPQKPLLDSLFKPYASLLRMVEDDSLRLFSFAPSENSIGTWQVTRGYRVEALGSGTVRITGIAVDPAAVAIPFQPGWQTIPFFGRRQQSTSSAMASIVGQVDILKDNAGKAYIPSLGINSLQWMLPGQGYKLRAKAAGTLSYPLAFMQKSNAGQARPEEPAEKFRLPEKYITPSNATLAFIAAELGECLDMGDEIGVFSPEGRLVGAAKYQGQNLAIPVWGDDPYTAGRQGLLKGEPYQLKVWKKSEGRIYTLKPVFAPGQHTYLEDDLVLIQQAELVREYEKAGPALHFQMAPNPASGQAALWSDTPVPGLLHIRLMDMNGRVIRIRSLPNGLPAGTAELLDLSGLPKGVYLVHAQHQHESWTGRIVVLD